MTRFRFAAALTSACVGFGLLGAGVTPAAASGGGTKVAASAAAPDQCTLRRSGHSPNDEWASCLGVSASISRVPAVGEEATLKVTVRAQAQRAATDVQVDLPDRMTLVSADGATVSDVASVDGAGRATRASSDVDLVAGASTVRKYVVRADRAGEVQIRVRALAPVPGGSDGASDDVFMTVGTTAATSHLGFTASTFGGTETRPNARVTEPVPAGRSVGTKGLPAPHSDDPAPARPQASAGQSCVYGYWNYNDNNAVAHPSRNYQVQAWDRDVSSGDDLLASGTTDSTGYYHLCFNNDDVDLTSVFPPVVDDVTQEVYVLFVSENNLWRVRDTASGNNNYVNNSAYNSPIDVCDACEQDFGSLWPANGIDRGMHAFDAVYKLWLWVPSYCFDANDVTCRQMVLNWTTSSTDGTYYSTTNNDVHLKADDPNAETTVIHESTHATMDDVYEDNFPAAPNCSPHYIQNSHSAGCAWTEGFAEWVPATVLNDPYYRWPDGSSLDLETPTWGTGGWANGDTVEGRVAGAMIDVSDANNEQYWDYASEGGSPQWQTFLNQWSSDFNDFYNSDRVAQGYETTNALSRGSVFQDTIDYSFRDELSSDLPKIRPTPSPDHNYHVSAPGGYWSAAAVRPPTGTDYDLVMYDDAAKTSALNSSAYGAGWIDFVAVDGNRRAADDLYPTVHQYAGTGNYDMEFAAGSTTFSDGTRAVNMGSGDVVWIADTWVNAGLPVYFRVQPGVGSQDPELELMASTDATPNTYVPSRGQSVAHSYSNPAGVMEAIQYTSAATQWDALVLLNKSGSGTYTLYRDTTAPTGSVSINAGAALTQSANVTLSLPASDVDTSVESMRISTDGTMDSEAWVPYSATANVTLPAPDGTKTVLVQYRNYALMESAVFSDTISMDTRPDLVPQSITNPPATAARGTSFSVTDVVKNTGGSTAGASVTWVYLSKDNVPDASDIQIGGRVQAALAAGATSSGTYNVTVPNSVPADNYFLLVCNDVAHAVAEFLESNNCKVSTTKVAVWSGQLVFHTNIDNSFVPSWTAAATRFGVTLANLPRTGAGGLVFLMGPNPASTPFTPAPANNGPYVITTTYTAADAALVERYATALSLTGEQFLYLGAYFYVYLYLLGV